jgi:hypothetical protein
MLEISKHCRTEIEEPKLFTTRNIRKRFHQLLKEKATSKKRGSEVSLKPSRCSFPKKSKVRGRVIIDEPPFPIVDQFLHLGHQEFPLNCPEKRWFINHYFLFSYLRSNNNPRPPATATVFEGVFRKPKKLLQRLRQVLATLLVAAVRLRALLGQDALAQGESP